MSDALLLDRAPADRLNMHGTYVAPRDGQRVWNLPDGRQILGVRYDYDLSRFIGRTSDGEPYETGWQASLMPQITGPIRGWCSHIQGRELMRLSAAASGEHVEVGSARGLSATWIGWGARQANAKLRCVDLFQGAPDSSGAPHTSGRRMLIDWRENIDYAGLRDTCWAVRGDSTHEGHAYQGAPIGFLYIDALHTYEGCRQDFLAWTEHCADGAVVCFDDCLAKYPGILRFQRELLAWHHAELLSRADAMLAWRIHRP